MPLASISSDDFGGGIYRGRKAPANSVYDLVNGLINDEGLIYRRGGSEYYSGSDIASATPPKWLSVAYMPAPDQTRVIAAGPDGIYAHDGTTPVETLPISGLSVWSRPVSIGDFMVLYAQFSNVVYYGGSLKSATYTTGTVAFTNGSTAVTGVGTAWLANVDPGMIMIFSGERGAVKTVNSDTSITLASPWVGATSAGTGAADFFRTFTAQFTFLPNVTSRLFVAAAGAGSPRLLLGTGNRVYYTPRGQPYGFDATSYHELPSSAVITGMEGRGDSVLVFTTGGVWSIGNLSFDDVDAFGNIQHTVEMVTKDVVLWDDHGIAGWAGGLVVPAIDDVYLAGDGFALTPITGRVRPLYRAYVKAGYTLGMAAVHNGHYVLPILNGTTWVDTLVCRLDRDAAWSRWSGHAAGTACAVLAEEAARTPKLLGLGGARVLDLSGAFDPTASNASDADATVADLVITTRDYPTGQQPGFFAKARARYELEDDGSGGTAAPTVAIAFTSDADAGTFTILTDRGEQGGAAGWGVSAGDKYQWATVGKARERGRLRITVSGACARFVLRSVELLIRQSGKQ